MGEGGKTAAVRCTVLRVTRPGKSGGSEEKTLGYCPPRSGLLELGIVWKESELISLIESIPAEIDES
jgi:hypothetical protein